MIIEIKFNPKDNIWAQGYLLFTHKTNTTSVANILRLWYSLMKDYLFCMQKTIQQLFIWYVVEYMHITGQHDLGHHILIIFYFIVHLENGTSIVRIMTLSNIIIRYLSVQWNQEYWIMIRYASVPSLIQDIFLQKKRNFYV